MATFLSLCANQPTIMLCPIHPLYLSTLLLFYASAQSGGIVGQGHRDNPLALCRRNDRALNYIRLGPMTVQQSPPPLPHPL